MEKRAVLAVVLSVSFFIAWNYFVIKPHLKDQTVSYIEKNEDIKTTVEDKRTESASSDSMSKDNISNSILSESLGLQPVEGDGNIIKVNTELAEILLTNKGGLIKSLKLKKHLNEENTPLDIINYSEGGTLPLSLEFSDPGFTSAVNNSLFTTSVKSLLLDQNTRNGTIAFTLKSSTGFSIQKIITFYTDKYKIGVRIVMDGIDTVSDIKDYTLLWGPGINSGRAEKDRYTYEGATTFINDEPVNNSVKKLTGKVLHKGELSWTALQNKFFAAILIPEAGEASYGMVKKENKEDIYVGLTYPLVKSHVDNNIMVFAGPKEFDRIKSYNLKLERLIDYGFIGNAFKFLVSPIFLTLKAFYRISHNYGISIIILTVLIKLVFLPLSQKSLKSMEKTKKFQPQLKLIQERYKNDKAKLNEEIMKFYKENKINPLGGCLPMIVQIPVFFALYNVLLHSVELRHAPFVFWITDLSVKDPFYVTPILMGVTMLIQQKMTPSTGDPIQAKMVMIMPIIFTVMFLSFPVGLVIYWLINNIMTIGQQYLISKKRTK